VKDCLDVAVAAYELLPKTASLSSEIRRPTSTCRAAGKKGSLSLSTCISSCCDMSIVLACGLTVETEPLGDRVDDATELAAIFRLSSFYYRSFCPAALREATKVSTDGSIVLELASPSFIRHIPSISAASLASIEDPA